MLRGRIIKTGVCVYIRNYSTDRTKIWYAVKSEAFVCLVKISSKLIYGLEFYDILYFTKNNYL